MRHLLPTGPMVAVFAVMAVVCGMVAALTSAHDTAMALFAVPIFIFAAFMGMRRSGEWASLARPALDVEETDEEAAV